MRSSWSDDGRGGDDLRARKKRRERGREWKTRAPIRGKNENLISFTVYFFFFSSQAFTISYITKETGGNSLYRVRKGTGKTENPNKLKIT